MHSPAAQGKRMSYLRQPIVAALLSSVLLWLSFYPVNWGWVGWLAIVPLLSLVRSSNVNQAALKTYWYKPWQYGPIGAAWVGGLVFCLAAFQWIRIASTPMIAIWLSLALAMSLQYPLVIWILRRFDRYLHMPLWLAAPAVWTSLEWFRANLHIGFAWYFLGQSQHEQITLIQIADLAGVYGVSFLVVMVNAVVCGVIEMLATRRWWRPSLWAGLVVTALCIVASIGYGHHALSQTHYRPGPRLAIVQCNLEQDIRNDPNEADTMNRHLLQLIERAALLKADLIICPETSLAMWYMRIRPDAPQAKITAQWREQDQQTQIVFKRLSEEWQTEALIGMVAVLLEKEGERRYNAAVHFDAQGREKGLYAKIYCLPFGEYIPMEKVLPFLKWLSPYDYEYSTAIGEERTLFDVKSYSYAVLICYEDTVPQLAPQFMRTPRPPTFFVNISNDGWFKGCEEHEQHWVTAKFRAIECRRALVRSVNMGVSGVVDSCGRAVVLPDQVQTLSEGKARASVLAASVPVDDRASVFVAWGECWSVVVWGLVLFALLCTFGMEMVEARRGPTAAANSV